VIINIDVNIIIVVYTGFVIWNATDLLGFQSFSTLISIFILELI